MPLKGLKLSKGHPFHNTLKVDDSIQAIIRSAILLSNLVSIKVFYKVPSKPIIGLLKVHLYSHQTLHALHLSHRMYYPLGNNYIISNMSLRDNCFDKHQLSKALKTLVY